MSYEARLTGNLAGNSVDLKLISEVVTTIQAFFHLDRYLDQPMYKFGKLCITERSA